MKKIIIIMVITLVVMTFILFAQTPYPFLGAEKDAGIRAYWYNILPGEMTLDIGQKIEFHSSLHVYGRVPEANFRVEVQAFSAGGERVFKKDYTINTLAESKTVEFRGGHFKITQPVEHLSEAPTRISVAVTSSKGAETDEITCRYHKLSGQITDFDGEPFKAMIALCPDAFLSELCFWSDDDGHYEMEIPARTYNAVVAFPQSYGISELEVWGWHIIMDQDQALDFKVGTGEVYNLNVWPNNGGGHTFFISFRPMVLWAHEQKTFPAVINGRDFNILDASPELVPEDITVRVNGKEVEIISLQKYFETVNTSSGLPAYLIQVSREGLLPNGKQTAVVEYQKTVERNGKTVTCTSMGITQFYLNYTGKSFYF